MKQNRKSFAYGLCFSTFIGFSLSGCSTAEGPSKKEQVDQALEVYYRGEAFELSRDLEQARDAYLASIDISPRPRAYYRLAEVQFHLGQLEEARMSAEQALRLSPNYAQPRLLIQRIDPAAGISQIPDTTRESFQAIQNENALRIQDPTPTDDTLSLEPEIETTATDMPKVIRAYNELTPEEQALFNEARQAATAGAWDRAASLYEDVLVSNPNHPQVLHNYGYALFQLERFEQAEHAFRTALQSNPNMAEAYNDLGVTLEARGQIAGAVKSYENAIDKGNYGDAYFNLALLKEKLGEYRESISLYQRYLEYDSISAYADYSRERIRILRRSAF